MKLQMQMTEKDKKLITKLLPVVVVFAMIIGVIWPRYMEGREIRALLAQEMEIKTANDEKIQNLGQYQSDLTANKESYENTISEFNNYLDSSEVDRQFTSMALTKNLIVKDLNISMPQKMDYTKLKPYMVSDEDKSSYTYPGIYTAQVTMNLLGSKENLQAMLDECVEKEPGIRVRAFEWYTISAGEGEEYSNELFISVDVYMALDSEQYIEENPVETEEAAGETVDTTSQDVNTLIQ